MPKQDEVREYRLGHSIRWTSTGKGPWRGDCDKCGATDLPASAVKEECPKGTVIQCKSIPKEELL